MILYHNVPASKEILDALDLGSSINNILNNVGRSMSGTDHGLLGDSNGQSITM